MVAATPYVQTLSSSDSHNLSSMDPQLQLRFKPRSFRCAALPAASSNEWISRINNVRYGEIPTSFAAARDELARLAAPGSTWPAEARATVEAMADTLGGMFFVVLCGNFDETHPRAGQPALALFQFVFLAAVAPTEGQQSPYSIAGSPVFLQPIRAFDETQYPMAHIIAYELDDNGWPTGTAYNSATAFEKLTDRAAFKKVLGSTRIMHMGAPVMRPLTFFNTQLKPQGVSVPPRRMTRVVSDWGRDQLAAAGIKVLLKTDAVTMSRNHEDRSVAKRERRGSARAKAQNARAMGQADPAGQQLPASNGVPSSGPSGYPR